MNPKTNSLIASSVPGRLRLRDRALRDAARLDMLAATLRRWRGIAEVQTNPRTGSLLIHYDATSLAPERCEERAVAAAEKLLRTREEKVGAARTAVAAHARHTGGTPRVKANRWAKRGMLASLAVSLLLAAASRKRWHALTGVIFLHALAVHLWAHRRHVFR